MVRILKPALVLLFFFTLLTGLCYPFLMTGIVQVAFPAQANGSLVISSDGTQIGSALIGQSFTQPEYFWGRLSATSGHAYNASASGSSNYSVMNPALIEQAQIRLDALHAADPENHALVPVDLVTASASGLDPHISPAAAYYQIPRVAKARGLTEAQVRQLVDEYTEKPWLGVLGETRVNILLLNLALDSVQ